MTLAMTKYSLEEPDEKTDPSSRACQWSATIECLRGTALALTRSLDDADDLTQQTLVTLLVRKPDRTDHIGYARKTLVRLWLDQQRSLRRRLVRLGRLARTAKPWSLDRDRLAIDEQYQRMQHAIEALPPRQKAVLVLRLVEELDYAEIARTLGCSVQTVRANLHLGRQRVRQLTGEPL